MGEDGYNDIYGIAYQVELPDQLSPGGDVVMGTHTEYFRNRGAYEIGDQEAGYGIGHGYKGSHETASGKVGDNA